MSSDSKKRKIEDKDENCRLRHGLNVHCLAHIFQYLDSGDLFTVGEMNAFYKQIINDLIISKHEVDCDNLYKRDVTISQFFEKYGKKIRKIFFLNDLGPYESHSSGQLLRSITQYCLPDQLKCVVINCDTSDDEVNLPNHFRNVERFGFYGSDQVRLCVQLSESLRSLILRDIDLYSTFNWSKLSNLAELYLNDVEGINVQNFIEFLRLRPKIQVFHHDQYAFKESTQTICEAVAKYCGIRIQHYSGKMPLKQGVVGAPVRNLYSFISQFENVKGVCLESQQMCGGDLIDPLKRLAENDTIESLDLIFTEEHDSNCIFQERPSLKGLDMRHFSHLKTIAISGYTYDIDEALDMCEPFKLLNLYGPQIFSNVEDLTFKDRIPNFIIKFAQKLRRLKFYRVRLKTPNQAAEILSSVESVLRNRKNGGVQGDFIEIMFRQQHIYDIFTEIGDCSDSIKLHLCADRSLEFYDLFRD